MAWIHLRILLNVVVDEYGGVEFCADDGGVVFHACGLNKLFWGFWGVDLYLLFQLGNNHHHHHHHHYYRYL